MTAAKRYNKVVLALLRDAIANGTHPSKLSDSLVDLLKGPSDKPTPSETRWLNVISARLDAELTTEEDDKKAAKKAADNDNGEDKEDEDDEEDEL